MTNFPQTIQARRMSLAVLGAAVLTCVAASSAWSIDSAHVNYLTFSKPVALPGVILPAGSYVFEVANPTSGSPVVRVASRSRGRVLFAGFTERAARPANLPASQPIALGEAEAGNPPPITAWYPIGLASGHRFVYR